MAQHNDFGKLAEDLANDFLANKGYEIVARNYRWEKYEIDIIAKLEETIVIVEVKARGTDIFIEPQEAVTKRKMKNIVVATDAFLQENNLENEVRFDIISVLPDKSGKLQISHLEDAFEAIDAN